METLAELLRVADTYTSTTRHQQIGPGPDGTDTTLLDCLLQGVRSGRYDTDDDAAMDLYGAPADDRRYRTLKTRAYDRVLRALTQLRIKPPAHSETFAIYYRCLRNLVATHTLVRLRSRKAAYSIALRTIVLAERYEFTDLVLPLSLVLRDTAALWNRRQAFDEFDAKYRWAMQQLHAEQEADYMLDLLILESHGSAMGARERAEQHRVCAEAIGALLRDHPSTALRISKARADIGYCLLIRDFDALDAVCEEILTVISTSHRSGNRARIAEFNIHRMAAHVFRRTPIPTSIVDSVFGNLGVGGHNWFVAKGLQVSSLLLTGFFQEAELAYIEAIRNERFTSIAEPHQERWLVIHAHLVLAEVLGLLTPTEPRAASFRLSTFLNSVHHESLDKANTNLLILILHSLFLVCSGQSDEAERRIQYLNVYASRYVRNETQSRPYLMIKALQYVPRYAHRPADLRAMLAPYIDRIHEAACHPMQGEINELLPYDVLLEALQRRLASQTRV